MKIGVVFHGNPLAGGGFHDGLSSTLLVANLEKDFDFAFYTPDLENAKSAKKAGLQTKLIKFGRLHKLGYQARKKNSLFSLLQFFIVYICITHSFYTFIQVLYSIHTSIYWL